MNALLGSEFETSLRIIILLEAAHEKPLKTEEIVALDFITVYSSDFGITDSNLHGESKYRFGEYASRRELIKCAIKRLVLDGLINVLQTAKGFEYSLTQTGLQFMANLNSEYTDAYYETAMQVLINTRDKSGRALSEMVNRCIISSLGGG